MFRRTLRKIVPEYAIFPLCLTAIMMAVSYAGAKAVQFFISFDYVDITSEWDQFFAFEPAWILAYIGSYFFWIYQYTTVGRESPEKVYQLAAADAVAKIICLVFFIALPATNVRPEVKGTGFIPFLMRLMYTIDTPTNLFPSIHCFVAWMGTRYIFECKKIRRKWLVYPLCFLGTILVFLSTLHTKQHVVWDVISGIAVAEVGWLVARFTKLPKLIEKLSDRFLQTKLSKFL